MTFKPNPIGIDAESAEAIATPLTEVLAEYNVLYSNLRAFHWNVRGPLFLPLHELFEQIYTRLNKQIDDVAERISALGFVPMHTMSAYLATASIKEEPYIKSAEECIKSAGRAFNHILEMEREIALLAGDVADEGTLTLISDIISTHEKDAWLLACCLSSD